MTDLNWNVLITLFAGANARKREADVASSGKLYFFLEMREKKVYAYIAGDKYLAIDFYNTRFWFSR